MPELEVDRIISIGDLTCGINFISVTISPGTDDV
jgi:hypothetical protein